MNSDITSLLEASGGGNKKATAQLFNIVYAELHTIAKSHRRRWVGNETLNTTALINEAFIKLQGHNNWASRTHFYATAAKAMRQVLVSYAEMRKAGKRGGDSDDLPFDDILVATDDAAEETLALHEALERMATDKPRWAQIVECRFFGGLSIHDTAAALNISDATVGREWKLASAWLYATLHEQADTGDPAQT